MYNVFFLSCNSTLYTTIRAYVEPVSYTHLDVYKRQVYRMCQGQDQLTPEERPFVNCMPPWAWTPPNVFISLPGDVTKTETPEFLKQVTLRTIEENYNDHLHIYTCLLYTSRCV